MFFWGLVCAIPIHYRAKKIHDAHTFLSAKQKHNFRNFNVNYFVVAKFRFYFLTLFDVKVSEK